MKNVAKLVLLGFAFIGSLVVYPLEYLFGLARKRKAVAPISFSLEGAVGFVDGIAQELDFGFNFLNEQIEKGINKIPRRVALPERITLINLGKSTARLIKGSRLWSQDSTSQGDFEAYTRELKAVSVLAVKLLVAASLFSLRWTRKKIEAFVNQLVIQSINYGKLFLSTSKADFKSFLTFCGYVKDYAGLIIKVLISLALMDIKVFSFSRVLRTFKSSRLRKRRRIKRVITVRPGVGVARAAALSRRYQRLSFFKKFAFFSLGIVFALLFIFVPYQIYTWFRQLPNPALLAYEASIKSTQPTRLYDRKGRLLYEIYIDKRYEPVALDQLPSYLVDATIAVEDDRFYNHIGFRVESIIRAARANAVEENKIQGASTITQQLIKNVLLTPERTVERKVKELFLSMMVERQYSKREILEMYFNNISYGGNAWGVQSAAQKYFDKDAADLDLAEASVLAGLPSAPSVYSPLMSDIKVAKQRQKYVLERMVVLGAISEEEAEEAYRQPLEFNEEVNFILAPHFVNFVRSELDRMYGKRYVDYGGLTVMTTLDLDLQEKVEEIIREEVEVNSHLGFSNGAAVVLDPKKGEILAYVGSVDYKQEGWGAYDVVTAMRQPGSSLKPITYALALQNGYTAASIVLDSPVTFQNAWESYRPVNYDGKYRGAVTLRSALAGSYNIPAVRMVNAVGSDNMVNLASRMGLRTWSVADGGYGLSVTLGGKETRLLDLTNVYATFARAGVYKEATPFITILDRFDYRLFASADLDEEKILEEEVAYIITHILSDNVARTPAFGSKSSLVIPGHTVAVKTGTTDYKKDNWTVGFTPSWVVGVWVGNNDNRPMNPYLASGLSGAAPIWNKLMGLVLSDTPVEGFDQPGGITVFNDPVCKRSEVFVKGSKIPSRLCVPKKKDDKDKEKDDDKDKKEDKEKDDD